MAIGVFDETFTIRKSKKDGVYEVAKFGDVKRCVGDNDVVVHDVTYKNSKLYCDCKGFRWHKDKPEEHKHCKLVKFWVDKLDSQPGFVLWFEGSSDDIEYRKFIDTTIFDKYLN